MRVQFERFYAYEELEQTLATWAGTFSALCQLESIGRSFEGREIPLVSKQTQLRDAYSQR